MTSPVTPRYYAVDVVLRNISLNYNPTWNGSAWVLDPSTIRVVGVGSLTDGSGEQVLQAEITIPANDLPSAGQAALQDLLQYVEDELAAKYS